MAVYCVCRGFLGAAIAPLEKRLQQIDGVRSEVARRWTPNASAFAQMIDGEHGYLIPGLIHAVDQSRQLIEELEGAGLDVVVIGSAQRAGRVYDAIHSAFFASRLV